MTIQPPPFHRLLACTYTNGQRPGSIYWGPSAPNQSSTLNRTPHPDTQTIRLQDSIAGNLSLGLDFPVALAMAIGRHLYLKNTALFSLNIHVPSVPIKTTLLDGLEVDEKKDYSCSEMWALAAPNGVTGRLDAVGLWALAADVETGKLKGVDVVGFQQGTVFQEIQRKRRGTEQVLPLWRGGPIFAAGHSWVVKRVWDVDVYQEGGKGD